MLAAYSLDRRLDDFMRTNNAVLNGEYGDEDEFYKQSSFPNAHYLQHGDSA